MNTRSSITIGDLPLILEVLHCNTSLEETLYAALCIGEKTRYPIESLAHLEAAFQRNDRIPLGGHTVRPQDLGEFLPDESFPIEARAELVSRLVLGSERIRMAPIHKIAREQGHEIAWNVEAEGDNDADR